MSFDVDAVGLYAERATYNNRPHGFAFLAADNGFLYLRLSATPGIWSGGVPFGKGDKGDVGPQGMQGPSGPQGQQGPQGIQGPEGLQGLRGSPGMVWRGQWYATTSYVVNDVVFSAGTSWIALQSTKGVQPNDAAVTTWARVASKGDAGPQGIQGPAGPLGPTGPAGPQGSIGAQGPTGPTGPTGPAGPTGLTGAQGPQGVTGPQGPQGDVSSRVAKSGDTMTGTLTLPALTILSPANYVSMKDTTTGNTRHLHHNENLMGFLDTTGNWALYENNAGQVWTKSYGWLHERFAQAGAFHHSFALSNCGAGSRLDLTVSGNSLNFALVNTNCACNCACCG
jgi:hypothetical protein